MSRFYITNAIAYVNGDPHLGHALELVQTDVLARHRRLRGDDVRYLSGTDENVGVPAVTTGALGGAVSTEPIGSPSAICAAAAAQVPSMRASVSGSVAVTSKAAKANRSCAGVAMPAWYRP